MSNEPLGIVEQRRADRAKWGHKLYRAPVILSDAPIHHIVVDVPSQKRTITRLDVPKPVPKPPKPQIMLPLPRHPRRVNDILMAVAEAYEISVGELLSEDKPNWIARPRFAAVGLLRGILKLSNPAIGRIINRDHTTAMAAHRRAAELRASDAEYRHRYRTAARIVRRKWLEASE